MTVTETEYSLFAASKLDFADKKKTMDFRLFLFKKQFLVVFAKL